MRRFFVLIPRLKTHEEFSMAQEQSNSHILTESVVTLKQVPKHVPTRPHFATVWRWSNRGIRGHKLETYLIGNQRLTSVEAIHRFLEATQG
jgi:hypothetical protein